MQIKINAKENDLYVFNKVTKILSKNRCPATFNTGLGTVELVPFSEKNAKMIQKELNKSKIVHKIDREA